MSPACVCVRVRASMCFHLWFPNFDDPGRRDYDSGVGPQ